MWPGHRMEVDLPQLARTEHCGFGMRRRAQNWSIDLLILLLRLGLLWERQNWHGRQMGVASQRSGWIRRLKYGMLQPEKKSLPSLVIAMKYGMSHGRQMVKRSYLRARTVKSKSGMRYPVMKNFLFRKVKA